MKLSTLTVITLTFLTSINLFSQVETVKDLYKDYSWEVSNTNLSSNKKPLLASSGSILNKYFSPEVVKMLNKDQRYSEITHDIGNLDFDPIYDSQDPAATNIKIVQSPSPSLVEVNFDLPNKAKKHLTYTLILTDIGWRINDINYNNTKKYSLQSILKTPYPKNNYGF